MVVSDQRLAVLAEAGTRDRFRCFALGAVVFEEGSGERLEAAAAARTRGVPLRWDSSEEDHAVVDVWQDAIFDLLRGIRDTRSEFRVIVCRKADYRVWRSDRVRGSLTAYAELLEDLTSGPQGPGTRPPPLVTDAHQRHGDVGVASANHLAQVATDRRVGPEFDALQHAFALFVSAIAVDTNSSLDPRSRSSRPVQDLTLSLADAISVAALRNDTWPPPRQDVTGEVRHNIWHFPEAFRSTPDISSSILIRADL